MIKINQDTDGFHARIKITYDTFFISPCTFHYVFTFYDIHVHLFLTFHCFYFIFLLLFFTFIFYFIVILYFVEFYRFIYIL